MQMIVGDLSIARHYCLAGG